MYGTVYARCVTTSERASWRLAHLPILLAVTGGVLGIAAVLGWLAAGAAGAVGAASGVGVAGASYLLSTLVIAWADTVNPQLVLPFGLMMYVVKFTLLGVVMVAVLASDWPGQVPMGWGVAAGVVGWTGAQIWWVVRHPPRLLYQPPDPGN
jgi:hypothetical protein